MTRIQKITNNGTNYDVLEPPEEVVYDVKSATYSGLIDGENEYWTVYIPMSSVREILFPLNANPRKPNTIGGDESRDIVVKMRRTLADSPNEFVRLNNGLTCVCSSLVYNENDHKISVVWGEGEGILNGGHTYLALLSYTDIVDAIVRVEIIVLSDGIQGDPEQKKQMIKDTAIARNSNRQLKIFTRAEFEGKHEILQSHLDNLAGCINWSEGYEGLAVPENKAMRAQEFIRYLAILDSNWFWHPLKPNLHDLHSILIAQGSAIYESWLQIALDEYDEHNLVKVAPLGRALINVIDHIREVMEAPIGCGQRFTMSRLYKVWAGNGLQTGISYSDLGARVLPKTTPMYLGYILNTIRPFIWSGETGKDNQWMIGWYVNLTQVYDEYYKDLHKKIRDAFERAQSPRNHAIDEAWASLVWYETIKPIWEKYCSTNPSDSKFFPSHFFDPESEDWYERDEEGEYYLIYDEDTEEWSIKQIAEGYSEKYIKMQDQPY